MIGLAIIKLLADYY